MKKIYSFIALVIFVTAAFAQSHIQSDSKPVNHFPQVYHKNVSVPADRAMNTFVIDYDSADAYLQHQSGMNYFNGITKLNWNFSKPAGDTLLGEKKYAVVAFDSAYDAYNQIGYPQSSYSNIRIDSLFAIVGHENNSGLDDTLILKIVSVDVRGYPTNTVLWADTTISTTFSLGAPWDDFNNLVELSWAPDLLLLTAKRFAVRLEYKGAKTDTFGLVYGFGSFNGPCPSTSYDLAVQTNFSTVVSSSPPPAPASFVANSFMWWLKYDQFGLLPQAQSGGDIYYPCDANTTYDPGVDGANYVQNWLIRALVTTDAPTGYEDEYLNAGMRLYQNVPNPFSNTSTISYELTKPGEVSLEIYDVTQRQLAFIAEGNKPTGKHNITVDSNKFSEGLYFYTLKVGDISMTKRMVITK
jgi:hypothetical protein